MKLHPSCQPFFGLRPINGVLITIIMAFHSGTPALAHRVNVFAYVEGDKVWVEGYFSASVKAQDSSVDVFDSAGTKILEGKTDSKGIYSFKLTDLPPVTGDIKIVLDAGMGHKADFILSAADLPITSQQTPSLKQTPKERESTGGMMSVVPSAQTQDTALLKAVVEDAVEQKIQPLVKMIGSQQKLLMEQGNRGPSLSEIIGGIGWIMGIVGIAAYLMSRNSKEKK